MKVVFCWSGMSGYMAACWRELARRPAVDTSLVVQWWSMPWSAELLEGLPEFRRVSEAESQQDELIHQLVAERKPDIVVLPGWTYRCFNRLPFYADLSHCKFIMSMDNPWQGTWRQRLARLKVGRLIDRMDAVTVTGERSFRFARHLGVPERKIMRGTYGIDYDHFAPLLSRRNSAPNGWPRRFLFTGRYEKAKGLDVLIAAYRTYRKETRDPWPLSCCGRGPLEALLSGVDGIENHGFVQPKDLAAIYVRSGAFVLPSRFDPWPLVLVEASAAGLPVLCSEACGSAVELVRPYYSGLVVPTDDVSALSSAMQWMHEHHDLLPRFGERAAEFARAYSAQAWADRWTTLFSSLRA